MDIEQTVNHWLANISQDCWQLEDGECHLNNSNGEHYATIQCSSSRLLVMFPLNSAYLPIGDDINSNLLLLNNHPSIIGFASFSIASDDRTIVLSMTLPREAINTNTLDNFWQRSIEVRSALFSAITDKETT